jgi:hypothetical protein
MNKTLLSFRHIEDPGHSWLAVPLNYLGISGVAAEISEYSPVRNGTIYLEEDCDLPLFYKAMTDKGYIVKMDTLLVDDFRDYLSEQQPGW